ncbi:MAG: hypothetical protein B1H04_00650 [Planctomycetales bacterium 4484_123]|nr:MAG: hypothetical protein B1H04_00650 [Planctomycetales bacterium 4484_123]
MPRAAMLLGPLPSPASKSRIERHVAAQQALKAENLRRLVELLRLQPRPPTVAGGLERLVLRYSRCRRGLPWKINQLLQHVERGSPNAICRLWRTPNLVEGQR